MAKIDKEEPIVYGEEEIRELDEIAVNSIPNIDELVSLYSSLLDRTVVVSRRQVFKYASVMSSNQLISDVIGIDKNTLAKYFKRELTMGRAFAKQKLIVRFYNLALFGNNPADRIFALKNWAGMSDAGLTVELEEMEEGVEFKIRRPDRQIEKIRELDENQARFDSETQLGTDETS